ncbi:MAG: hypothetical protein MZV70_11155 [Desulfobacterales bacterium]|nr:hypothetical protein [Desulfobacterales bacterium]
MLIILTQTKTYLSFLEDVYGDIEHLENNPDKSITYFGFNISGFAPLGELLLPPSGGPGINRD